MSTSVKNDLRVASITDRGLSEKRPVNEDSLLADPVRGIFAVADGVALAAGILTRGLSTRCARAAVYASPVLCMRARTRRLRSLWRGIVMFSFGYTTGYSPAARRGDAKD